MSDKSLNIGDYVECHGGPSLFFGIIIENDTAGCLLVYGLEQGCWQIEPSYLLVHTNKIHPSSKECVKRHWQAHYEMLGDITWGEVYAIEQRGYRLRPECKGEEE